MVKVGLFAMEVSNTGLLLSASLIETFFFFSPKVNMHELPGPTRRLWSSQKSGSTSSSQKNQRFRKWINKVLHIINISTFRNSHIGRGKSKKQTKLADQQRTVAAPRCERKSSHAVQKPLPGKWKVQGFPHLLGDIRFVKKNKRLVFKSWQDQVSLRHAAVGKCSNINKAVKNV